MPENDDLRQNALLAELPRREVNSIPEIVLPEPEITVQEPLYLWPSNIPQKRIGDFSGRSKLLKITTRLIQKLYPSSTWIPIVKSDSQFKNKHRLHHVVIITETLIETSYTDPKECLLFMPPQEGL